MMTDIPVWKKNKMAYNQEFNRTHYARLVMDIPREVKERMQRQAAAKGLSLTKYVLECVEKAEGFNREEKGEE